MSENSETERCKDLMNHYADLSVASADPDSSSFYLDKAVYWSIELDIENYWENYRKQMEDEFKNEFV